MINFKQRELWTIGQKVKRGGARANDCVASTHTHTRKKKYKLILEKQHNIFGHDPDVGGGCISKHSSYLLIYGLRSYVCKRKET